MPVAGQPRRPVDPTAVAGWGREDVVEGPQRGRAANRRPGGPPGPPNGAKKKRRRRKITAIATATTISLFVVLMGVGYALVNVPLPEEEQNPQTSFVYYADGRTEMTRYAIENREDVPLSKVPLHVQQAVIAAEDRTFYENSGISFTGIGRAISGLLTGEDKGGGSTITQQYIKNSRKLTQERSFVRKAKEIPMAIKADQKYKKEDILGFYLNTIYFGRGAYGIQAASKAYFNGRSVDTLTVEEGAVLAGVIKDPTNLDPENNLPAAQQRWHYVINGMGEMGNLPAAQVAAAKYPKVYPARKKSALEPGNSTMANAVVNELKNPEIADRIPRKPNQTVADALLGGGFKIYTTVDARLQRAAVRAAKAGIADSRIPKVSCDNETADRIDDALVAIDPATGGVVAYYGGDDCGKAGDDMAGRRNTHPPGSSMKPYVLATAVDQGISIKSLWNPVSPRFFKDRGSKGLRNASNPTCNPCTLVQTTALSLNTIFWELTDRVGPKKVRETAAKAGLSVLGRDEDTNKAKPILQKDVNGAIGIGEYAVSVVEHANGFATFAAGGVHRKAHLIKTIRDAKGNVIYDFRSNGPKENRAFSEDAARDAGFAMQAVIKANKKIQLTGGRQAAGKTGTQDANGLTGTKVNSNVWMCGYTPQLAASVWLGHRKNDSAPIKFKDDSNIPSTYTGAIWKDFMDEALQGKPDESLPDPVFAGDESKGEIIAPPQVQTPPSEAPVDPGLPPLIPTKGPDNPQPTPDNPDPNPVPSDFPPSRPPRSPGPPPPPGFG